MSDAPLHAIDLHACHSCRAYAPRTCRAAGGRQHPLPAYPVENLCFEDATTARAARSSDYSLSAHGGVLATHHLSPASRYEARSVARDPNLSMAQRSRRIPRQSEIEFFNGTGHWPSVAKGRFRTGQAHRSYVARAASPRPHRAALESLLTGSVATPRFVALSSRGTEIGVSSKHRSPRRSCSGNTWLRPQHYRRPSHDMNCFKAWAMASLQQRSIPK